MTDRRRRIAHALLALGALAVLVYPFLLDHPRAAQSTWLAPGIMALAVCVLRARTSRRERDSFVLLAAAVAIPTVGYVLADIIGVIRHSEGSMSAADAFRLVGYPLSFTAVVRLTRARVPGARRTFWLDALLGAMTTVLSGAVLLALTVPEEMLSGAAAPGLVYPVLDLFLFGFALTVWLMSGRQLGRGWIFLAGAFAVNATADLVLRIEIGRGLYDAGAFPEGLWLVGGLLLGAAAVDPPPRLGRRQLIPQTTKTMSALASGLALAAFGMNALATGLLPLWIPETIFVVVLVRMWAMTMDLDRLVRDNRSVARSLERHAARQAAIAQLGSESLHGDDLAKTCQQAVAIAVDLVGAELGVIYARSGQDDELAILADQGPVPVELRELSAAGPDWIEARAGKLLSWYALDHVHVEPIELDGGWHGALLVAGRAPIAVDGDEPDFLRAAAVMIGGELHRQHTQAAMWRAQRMESVGRLAGAIAHDFNNLLGIVRGAAEEGRQSVPDSCAAAADFDLVLDAAGRGAVLIRQLLSFAKGGREHHARVLDLRSEVRHALPLLERAVGKRCRVDYREGRPVSPILADPGQVEQALLNLGVNARDAMPEGGTLTVSVGERHDAQGYWTFVTVADSGVGMSEEVRARAFDPFFSTKGSGGTGLGLATVYGTVTAAGGQVDLQSTPGAGTAFTLSWPARPDEEVAAETEQLAESPGGVAPLHAMHASEPVACVVTLPVEGEPVATVLLVDDEPALRRIMARALARHGFRVVEASSGEDGLERAAAEREHIDLLLTDVMMPGMSGGELADRLTAERPTLPVLFMSGYAGDDASLRRWPGRLLAKPVAVETLVSRVKDELRAA